MDSNEFVFPTLCLIIKDYFCKKITGKLEISPFTINGEKLLTTNIITFGKASRELANDFNFNNDKVSKRQFEIRYCQEKKTYTLIDSISSTGLFIKLGSPLVFSLKR